MPARIIYGGRRVMSQSAKVAEGVFAVNKPQGTTSAGVLESLKSVFNSSKLFEPWIKQEKERLQADWSKQKGRMSGKQKRKVNNLQVKLGHGGTLDPLATGVLIVGVGGGTKTLNSFLACTKQYETVVVFGAATDSYDVVGKRTARAPYEHVTQQIVEETLNKFRGKIMQKPPIFSALKVKGKPLYEYARAGEDIPVEIEERPIEVSSLELVEWHDAGTHNYKAPGEEAEEGVKATARKLLDLPASAQFGHTNGTSSIAEETEANGTDVANKRKREASVDDLITSTEPDAKRQKDDQNDEELTMAGALPPQSANNAQESNSEPTGAAPATAAGPATAKDRSKDLADLSKLPVAPGPAVRIRMTVSSGFYVRSLAHDLGKAVGSLGYMAALVRTRQGDFEVGKNAMEATEFEKAEDVWAPKLRSFLEAWGSLEGKKPG